MKTAVTLTGLAVVLSCIFYSASARKQPPLIPRNMFHTGVSNNAACTTCHTPGMQAPLKDTHVVKEECLECHQRRAQLR